MFIMMTKGAGRPQSEGVGWVRISPLQIFTENINNWAKHTKHTFMIEQRIPYYEHISLTLKAVLVVELAIIIFLLLWLKKPYS